MRELTLIDHGADHDWRQFASCADTDPDSMQPERATPAEVELAKRVCVGCPVRDQCLGLAKAQGSGAYGIHAGQWFGRPPMGPDVDVCDWCESDMPPAKYRGQRAKFCGQPCRWAAAYARKKAGAA